MEALLKFGTKALSVARKFKADAREFARRAMIEDENKEDEDPYAGVYDDVPTSLWKERMTDEDEEDDWEEPLF